MHTLIVPPFASLIQYNSIPDGGDGDDGRVPHEVAFEHDAILTVWSQWPPRPLMPNPDRNRFFLWEAAFYE